MPGLAERETVWGYEWCPYDTGGTNDPAVREHFDRCLYHDWPLAYRIHGVDPYETQGVEMPWGEYNPLHMVRRDTMLGDEPVAAVANALPDPAYPDPAFFAVMPLTHLEAVEYVEEDTARSVEKSGLELYVVEE